MPRRYFRHTDGRWAAAAYDNDRFEDAGEDLAERVAASLGLAPGTLRVVDVTGTAPDPRTGTHLSEPIPEPVPPSQDEIDDAARDAADTTDTTTLHAFLEANPDPAAWTNAQLRDGLVRLIRANLRAHRLIA